MHHKRNRKGKAKTTLISKTALITGASSGIGVEYAKVLASKSYNLVIVSNEEAIHDVANSIIHEYKVDVKSLLIDLATDEAPYELFNYCKEQNIQIDVLVNNAGILVFNEIDHIPDKKVEAIIKLHVQTPTLLCKLFGTEMKKRREGHILLMSSLAAWIRYPGILLYSATKRYLKDFGKAFHYEMKDYNVGVTTICPGAINTNMYTLSNKYRKIALFSGIMMNPDKLAKKAIRKMFKNRTTYIPGFLTKISIAVIKITPMSFVQFIRHKTGILEKRKNAEVK